MRNNRINKSSTKELDFSLNQLLKQKSYKRNKHMDSPSCKIIRAILKMDQGGTQKNGAKDEKIDDYT